MSWLDRLSVRAVSGDLLDVAADAIAVPVSAGLLPHGELMASRPGFAQVLAEQRVEHPEFGARHSSLLLAVRLVGGDGGRRDLQVFEAAADHGRPWGAA